MLSDTTQGRLAAPRAARNRSEQELLIRLGIALYGAAAWRQNLSIGLNIDLRTIQRWSRGEREIPPGIWGSIVRLGKQRASEIAHSVAMLEEKQIIECS